MDSFSELGPLDVQLMKKDEISASKSGLLSHSSFEALQEASFQLFEHMMLNIKRRSGDLISFKLAAEVSSNLTGEMMAGIYSQMNPDVIGDDYRDLQVALHYGVRLVGFSKNASLSAVKHLVEHYPSHDFVIDDEEAAALFRNVSPPKPMIYDLVELLGDAAYGEHKSGVVRLISKSSEEHDGENDAHDDAEENQQGAAGGADVSPVVDEGRQEDRSSDSATRGDEAGGGSSQLPDDPGGPAPSGPSI